MPRDRRARRSLPSAVERNLSLRELLGDDDTKRHARRRKSQEKQHNAALESLNAYFAMIDKTELKVEKAPTPPPEPSGDDKDDAHALSDSELARPKASTACRTHRTVRRRNLQDATLQAEYRVYCDATAGVVKPRTIDEFARTIEPEVRKGMYEGILDVLPA